MILNSTASHYINGKWIQGEGEVFESFDPASNKIIWVGKIATKGEINEAYLAAKQAFISWSKLDVATRLKYLQEFAKKILINTDELAYLISLETGKPIWEAKTEAAAVVAKVEISIAAYNERSSTKHFNTKDTRAFLRFKPHGVIGVLGPFNFPAHLSNGHIIPALLAGNTVIYKPSELSPAVANFVIKCWDEIGLPNGVLNLIQGTKDCGKNLLDLELAGVCFTGSYIVGKEIHQHFGGHPEVILALEMGGNNPLVIEDINDLDLAIYYTIQSTYITAGQRCSCARRLMIPDNNQGDLFLAQFIEKSKNIKIGSFRDLPEPFMGPVISHSHALTHLNSQENLLKANGNALLKMELLDLNTAFLSPGIIDMTKAYEQNDQEIFAPLVQVYRYSKFEEAIDLANQTKYGLVASLFSKNESSYKFFLQHIRAGLINWNRPTTGSLSSLPFGGIGFSGNYRPSGYFAADYCAYPVSSLENKDLVEPQTRVPGLR